MAREGVVETVGIRMAREGVVETVGMGLEWQEKGWSKLERVATVRGKLVTGYSGTEVASYCLGCREG